MGESPLNQATFLPQRAPREAILDYSGVLTSMQTGRLERQAYSMSVQGLKVKVVVLPKDFSTPDVDAFGVALARQWKVSADRLLMVVDLKDHKVKMYPGHDLEAHGLTSQLLSADIIPHHFIPYMKRGDLFSAIYSTLESSQNTVGKTLTQQAAPGQTRAYQQYPSNAQGYAPQASHDGGFGFLIGVGLLIAAGGGIFAFAFKSRKQDNHKLAENFKERAGRLYERADQIGSASEYLSTEKYPELAQRIGQFFNKLTTLEKAVSEVDGLEKRNQVWQVRDGYLKLIRLASILEPEADSLKTDVYAVTGGVQTVPELPAGGAPIEPPAEEKQRERIAIPARFQDQMQYRRPEWTYQPAYSQPADSGLSGLMMLGMMLNQFEMSRRLDEMNWQQMHHQGGGWFGSDNQQPDQQQQNFDPGWGDSGGSAGFGDAGGDWGGGGGGDLGGGGGDFGGGGGDW